MKSLQRRSSASNWSTYVLLTLFLGLAANAQEQRHASAKGVIYGITPDNQLMWMRHDGRDDGSFRWAPMPNGGKKVGSGWNFKQVFGGGNGVIYAVKDNGDLVWYRHEGRFDGSFAWANNGATVGTGWQFKQVFSGGDGVIYAVTNGGDLMWMRHEGRLDGTFRWAPMPNGGKKVGSGWNFKQIFSGGNGIIYYVNDNNELMWFRHDGRNDGSASWTPASGGRKVGSGWAFKQIFSGGDGVIYALTENGDLMWMRHDGRGDGSFVWAPMPNGGKKVGVGWSSAAFRLIFAE
jgi:hypothetical protein